MSGTASRVAGPRFTKAQPNPPPALGHAGSERALANAHEVDVDQLRPDPKQPRQRMDAERLAELAASIAAHGVLQPLLVRAAGFDARGDMQYRIIAGGRRYAAVQLALGTITDPGQRARMRRVPVVISSSEELATRVLQLIENLQREDLAPIEEAHALKELMTLEGLSLRGLAGRVSRSLGYVEERLRLLRHREVTEAVEQGLLTKSAGAAVASLPDPKQRQAWLERARAGESVQPASVYTSKGSARRGQKADAADATTSPAGASAPSPAAPTVQPGDASLPAELTPPQWPTPAALPGRVQNMDTATIAGAANAKGPASDQGYDEALRAAVEALLVRRKPAEEALLRSVVREVLELGAAQGRTCAALLPFVRRPQEQ